MAYLTHEEYEYVMNKYRDYKNPTDSVDPVHRGAKIYNRFIRRDEIFDAATGMAGDDIIEGILREDMKIADLPHPIRKSRALKYVLENTRIACDARDLFPAINMVDRPLNKTLINEWKKEIFSDVIPEIEKKRAHFEDTGIVTIWPDYDHSVPVWTRLFKLGFSGILKESEAARARHKELTAAQDAFFEGIRITYSAILDFHDRLERQARKQGSGKLAAALCSLKTKGPETFYEALLINYLYFMICEHVEGLQVRSLSNFDKLFYPYWKRDLENGKAERELKRELAFYLMQFASINNYWGQPVFLGGCNADESTVINPLSYIFLDVYDELGIYNPKIQLKICDKTPRDFILKALDMIRRGHNSIVFVSDRLIRSAMVKAGYSEEDARECNITGCYEYSAEGCYGSGSMNYVNLLKPLEFALHEGCDGVNGVFAGLKSPRADEYESFEEFYAEYKKQLLHLSLEVVEISNGFEPFLAEISPQSMLSGTIPECLEKARDAMIGGARSNGNGLMYGFIADMADSLTNVKKYVFDEKRVTLGELRDMLDNDFRGNESFRLKLYCDRDKYGNNRDLPDFFAKDIAAFLSENICGIPTSPIREGKWTIGFHVARMSYSQAPFTASSPNGRLKGEELSKNVSASMGQNREGATAAILSATKIDASEFMSDAALDLGLLPSAVSGEDGLMAMYGLLKTFVDRGGHALHINVFSADTLRNAQANPEKYRDLQIRVCGWNVLWNDITKEEQDGFIRQAEALI